MKKIRKNQKGSVRNLYPRFRAYIVLKVRIQGRNITSIIFNLLRALSGPVLESAGSRLFPVNQNAYGRIVGCKTRRI